MTTTASSTAFRTPIDGRHRQMFVDGAWVDAASGATMPTLDPATGEVLATVPRSAATDIDAAVAAARRAFDGPWGRARPAERQLLLLRIADAFERHWDELSLSDTLDMGKPLSRSRADKGHVTGMLRYYAGLATGLDGRTIDNSLPGEFFSSTRKEPIGVVGAIIPWNAPCAASVWKIGPALAAGCTIVLKPSEEAPLTPLLIAGIMSEAGVPDGVVNVVTGTGVEAGAPLAEHMGVDKVVFTGSTATGQSIVRASAGNLKRVSLELGGKSPLVVCADADLDQAVPTAALSAFANSGQICIAGSRLLVERSLHDEFVERLGAYAAAMRVGRGIDPETEIGPLVSAHQLERVTGFLDSGREQGARVVTGGARLTGDMRIATEEIFGPVISAMPFDTLDEAVQRANATPYGLAAGVFTRDVGRAHQLANRLHAGSVWVKYLPRPRPRGSLRRPQDERLRQEGRQRAPRGVPDDQGRLDEAGPGSSRATPLVRRCRDRSRRRPGPQRCRTARRPMPARSWPPGTRRWAPGHDMARVRDLDVPTRSGSIPARLLVPHDTVAGLIVYLHGGWVVGTIDDYAVLGRELAARAGCAVLLPDYRLAPEHPFPAGLEDVEDALLGASAAALAGAGAPLVVAGDSAGANLAIIATRHLRAG